MAKQTTNMDRILYSAFKKDIAPLEIFLAIVAIFSFPTSCLFTQLFFTKTNIKPMIPNAGKNLTIISMKYYFLSGTKNSKTIQNKKEL
jgi:hypothetical protein